MVFFATLVAMVFFATLVIENRESLCNRNSWIVPTLSEVGLRTTIDSEGEANV